jgi:hypothetical protein
MNETTLPQTVVEKPVEISKDLQVDENGILQAKSFSDQYRMAKYFLASKLLPKFYDTPEKVVIAIQYASQLGLKPLVALRQIAVVNGTPSIFGDLPLALVYQSGQLETIDEFYFDREGKKITYENGNLASEVFGHVTIVKRKGDPTILESFFTLDDAARAGLNSPVWKAYPKRMLKYRSRSQALKDKFPDALAGASIAEYDFNEAPNEAIEIKSENKKIARSSLNDIIG